VFVGKLWTIINQVMEKFKNLTCYSIIVLLLFSCRGSSGDIDNDIPVANRLTNAQATDGQYISWREHIIDDAEISGVQISGSDGLTTGDLDMDGYIDVVSVHESDTEYDSALEGYIRIAFGSQDPHKWELITLAHGTDAAAAEDVAIDDINGDGYLDIIAACELAHLIYFQNPGTDIRSSVWQKIIPSITQNRGSFIRVFSADLDQDGKPEIISANKGDQLAAGNSDGVVNKLNPISYFEIIGNPLEDSSWVEHELIRVKIPINSQPIDIDRDGDLDIIAGSRGENRIVLFENVSKDNIQFNQYPISITGSSFTENKESKNFSARVNGFNMDFMDVNEDGRLDILLAESFDIYPLGTNIVWLEQPPRWSQDWILHPIGDIMPDRLVGLSIADINGDGNNDVIVGGYSRGDRSIDGDITINDPLGRLAWFENPGNPNELWIRHDISRRKRGMFDKFVSLDLDEDGDIDFLSTRGNSEPYDGVFWLEQVRTKDQTKSFVRARKRDSEEVPLPQQ